MIDLVQFLWNLSFSLASFLLQSLLALRKAMSMAVSASSPTPTSSPLPWKRFAEGPLLPPKRSKEAAAGHRARHADDGVDSELHPRVSPAPRRWELVQPLTTAGMRHCSDDPRRVPQEFLSRHGEDPDVGGGHPKDSITLGCGEESMQRESPAGTPGWELPAVKAGGDGKVACPRVRRRPTSIAIPKTDMGSGFGEVGKVDSDGEFQAEGSCYCVASKRGNRRVMEDGYGVITSIEGDAKQAYFGVFDGHGGRAAVDHVSKKLGDNIIAALGELEQKGNGDPEMAVVEGYLTTDKEFLSQGVGSGVCAATVLLKDGELHAANVGDCRVVMSRKGTASVLTADHRPQREDERVRIENSGGYVSCHHGVWRVQGSLAVSRAIGDLHVKDWIISLPETTRLRLTSDCEFLIIASDGLWDKVSNQEAVDVVAKHKNFLQSCKELIDISSSRGSRDDITVMVVDLQRFVQGS